MNPLVEYPRTADLAYWIMERESIRHRREAGLPAPWTSDPDMANVRYCNVHREDDKVTKWIRANPVYSGPSVPVWRVVLARMLNRIESLELVQGAVAANDLETVKLRLKVARQTNRIWGNAYTISTCGKSMDKVDYVIDWVVRAVKDDWLGPTPSTGFKYTCQEYFNWLTSVDGLGSFLAAQVVADLKNMPGHPLSSAPDKESFVTHGPGSLKGVAAYFGTPCTPGSFKGLLALIAQQVTFLLPAYVGPIHMQDLQNCMCEFSKYIRVREGGRARNTYPPTNRIQKDTKYGDDDDSCD